MSHFVTLARTTITWNIYLKKSILRSLAVSWHLFSNGNRRNVFTSWLPRKSDDVHAAWFHKEISWLNEYATHGLPRTWAMTDISWPRLLSSSFLITVLYAWLRKGKIVGEERERQRTNSLLHLRSFCLQVKRLEKKQPYWAQFRAFTVIYRECSNFRLNLFFKKVLKHLCWFLPAFKKRCRKTWAHSILFLKTIGFRDSFVTSCVRNLHMVRSFLVFILLTTKITNYNGIFFRRDVTIECQSQFDIPR